MATSAKITPPFAWLGKYSASLSLLMTLAIAAFFRFFQIGSLPPGLDTRSAQFGLQALDLLHRGWWPGFTPADGYAPLWVWIQAAKVAALGHTRLALLIAPAALGVLAVLLT